MSTRNLKDALLKTTKALPAANASNTATAIDLRGATIGAATEAVSVLLTVPALPALVEAKTVVITLQDSADNSSFAAIPGLAQHTVTGGTGGGAAASSLRVRLASTARRYLTFTTTVLTGGGDNTGVSATLEVLA